MAAERVQCVAPNTERVPCVAPNTEGGDGASSAFRRKWPVLSVQEGKVKGKPLGKKVKGGIMDLGMEVLNSLVLSWRLIFKNITTLLNIIHQLLKCAFSFYTTI